MAAGLRTSSAACCLALNTTPSDLQYTISSLLHSHAAHCMQDTQLSLAAVRAAFHRCALRFHPDRFSVAVDLSERTVAEQRFKAANMAWEALKPICQ
ncbi:hypothetical protein HaLaN_17624 [Haematococcus lacustris]|uniref:J domain-containing protein n=1 Tax=Haematococcus lacustris TaxID=44745 RepID=A0A699ZP28_HAELA|nr:hypothetical protein HaLaN_17624 [Haematococcus lacustris]